MTNYSPPRQRFLPNLDMEFMIRHRTPTILAGDLNARHRTFGYEVGQNPKGLALHRHVMNNRLNHLGPTFPTFFTQNTQTTPDCVLTNQQFFFNHHIQAVGMGPSDHVTFDITISVNTIQAPCAPHPDLKNTDWDHYKNLLQQAPLINIDGCNITDIHKGFDTLYETLQAAKDAATPIRTTIKKNNLHVTSKFKRLTKVLDRYHQALLTNGMTPHIQRAIRNTQDLLIQEGNNMKFMWWQKQIEKVELAARCNNKFWRTIKYLSGGSKYTIPTLKQHINGTEQKATTDEEKEEVFTRILADTSQINPEENRQFCPINERRVKQTLLQNANRITPEWTINLQSIRDPVTNHLPINNLDIVNSIKSLKNRAPGEKDSGGRIIQIYHIILSLTSLIFSTVVMQLGYILATSKQPKL